MRFLALLALAAAGCTVTPATACYEMVGINGPAKTVVIFDTCRGELIYRNLAPMSTDKAGI